MADVQIKQDCVLMSASAPLRITARDGGTVLVRQGESVFMQPDGQNPLLDEKGKPIRYSQGDSIELKPGVSSFTNRLGTVPVINSTGGVVKAKGSIAALPGGDIVIDVPEVGRLTGSDVDIGGGRRFESGILNGKSISYFIPNEHGGIAKNIKVNAESRGGNIRFQVAGSPVFTLGADAEANKKQHAALVANPSVVGVGANPPVGGVNPPLDGEAQKKMAAVVAKVQAVLKGAEFGAAYRYNLQPNAPGAIPLAAFKQYASQAAKCLSENPAQSTMKFNELLKHLNNMSVAGDDFVVSQERAGSPPLTAVINGVNAISGVTAEMRKLKEELDDARKKSALDQARDAVADVRGMVLPGDAVAGSPLDLPRNKVAATGKFS